MKVLILHNTYQQRGGEDTVFESELELLKKNDVEVDTLLYDNHEIKSAKDKLLTGLFSFYNPKGKAKLLNKINQFQPDIIHVHNFFPLASPSIFYAAKECKVPIVMTLHNYRLICPSAYLYFDGRIYEDNIHKNFPIAPILKGVYRDSKIQTASLVLMTGIHKVLKTWGKHIDRYITLTNFAKNKFLDSSLGAKPNQFVVKPNFVPDIGIGQDERKDFLFIGRLSEEKGISTLLEAFSKTDSKLKILGDGPLKEEVLKAEKAHPNIEYIGFKPRTEVVEMLKSVKALVFSSVWYEGMPMVILEALSVGTPVIAPNLGGPAEMIEDKKNGLIYETGNAQLLSEKISILENDDNLRQSLSANARQNYEEKYTEDINFKILKGIYEDVIKDYKKNPS